MQALSIIAPSRRELAEAQAPQIPPHHARQTIV
jgi:hypothetical protein